MRVCSPEHGDQIHHTTIHVDLFISHPPLPAVLSFFSRRVLFSMETTPPPPPFVSTRLRIDARGRCERVYQYVFLCP